MDSNNPNSSRNQKFKKSRKKNINEAQNSDFNIQNQSFSHLFILPNYRGSSNFPHQSYQFFPPNFQGPSSFPLHSQQWSQQLTNFSQISPNYVGNQNFQSQNTPSTMSRITEKSPKDCAAKQSPINSHNFNKRLFFYLFTLSLTLLFVLFLVWMILHPSKPEFSITQADINQLNLTRPYVLNSSIELTILSNNPNKKVGIYYDEIYAYASYKGLKITTDTLIPPFYQDHEQTGVLRARLVGYQQIVGTYFGYQVQNDQRAGKLKLDFKIFGKLSWKVGNWKSGKYRFSVNCLTIIVQFGATFSTSLSYVQSTECSTTV